MSDIDVIFFKALNKQNNILGGVSGQSFILYCEGFPYHTISWDFFDKCLFWNYNQGAAW